MSAPAHEAHEANRLSWNAATVAHNSHKGDQAAFFRAGGDTLFPDELALLGDVTGRTLLHLQCNAGQDTLSLARRGAVATGVDISDEAVAFARRLSEDSGIPATFERADVFDFLRDAAAEGRRWDVAFATYGALCWLSDLDTWARGVAGVLAPGGRFVGMEFHPAAMMFDEEMRLRFPYSSHGRAMEWADGVGDYVARSGDGLLHGAEYQEGVVDFRNPHRSMEFAWGLADVVSALLGAGLRLDALREYPYANGCAIYSEMKTLPGRRFTVVDGVPEVPLMYGVVASKPA